MDQAQLEASFVEFWKVYPRRVGKLAAMKAWNKAIKIASPETIIHAAQCYSRDRDGQPETYTAHASTWLNAGRWDQYEFKAKAQSQCAGYYAAFCSPELDAWERYGRRVNGKGYPRDRQGGWMFPTQWPPEEQGHAVNGLTAETSTARA